VIDDAVERVSARRLVSEIIDRLELPVRRAEGRHDTGKHLHIAVGILASVVEHERDVRSIGRRKWQLASETDVVEMVAVFLRCDVEERAVALGCRIENRPALFAPTGPVTEPFACTKPSLCCAD
jgi:hypothetical protein